MSTPATSTAITLASSVAEFDSLAKRIANSNLIPIAFKGKPDDVFVAMLMGNELGVGPMQSINTIDVIEGRARPRSRLRKVLALRNPNCEYFMLIEADETKATFETKRKNDPRPVRLTYTIAMAEKAGLTRKANWLHPMSMLMARCEGILADTVYADSTLGLPAEEYVEEGESSIGAPLKNEYVDAVAVDVSPAQPETTKGVDQLRETVAKKKEEAAKEKGAEPTIDAEFKEEKKAEPPAPAVKPEEKKDSRWEKQPDGSEVMKPKRRDLIAEPKAAEPATVTNFPKPEEKPKEEKKEEAKPPAAPASTTPPGTPYERCLALAKLRGIAAEVLKVELKQVGAKGPSSVKEEHYQALLKKYPQREPGSDDGDEPPAPSEPKEGDVF